VHIVLGYGSCDAVQVSRGHSQSLQPGLQVLDVAEDVKILRDAAFTAHIKVVLDN